MTGRRHFIGRQLTLSLLVLFLPAAARADQFHGMNPGAVWWNGQIALTPAKAAAIAATGCRAIRLNFRIDWGGAWDANMLATYDTIVNNATSNNLVILGLLCNEISSSGQEIWNDDPDGTGMNAYVSEFSTTAYMLIDRYKTQIKRWEIWNEPDVHSNPVTDPKTAGLTYLLPNVYANLLCETYKQCNFYDGHNLLTAYGLTLCTGGLGGTDAGTAMDYMQQVYDQATIWNSFAAVTGRRYPWDWFGYHFYLSQFGSVTSTKIGQWLTDVRTKQAAANDTTSLLITEFGWNTYNVTESTQRNNMRTAYDYLETLTYVAGTYWYQWQDESTTGKWGVLRADGTQKPSHTELTSQGSGSPLVPTGLTATVGDARIILKWNGGPGASTYNVKCSTLSGGPYNTIATGVTLPTCTHAGLGNGGIYYYVVSAVNNGAESANCAQIVATPAQWSMNGNLPAGANLTPLMTQQWAADSYNVPDQMGIKAIDGLITFDSKWVSNGNAPPHWLSIDLGKPVAVNGFVVRHASAEGEPTYFNTKSFSIQSAASMSGPWSDEVVIDNTGQLAASVRSYYYPRTLRYLRLSITNAGADNYARIPEFEVWGPAVPSIAVAPSSLSASCQLGSSPAAQTFTVTNSGTGALSHTISVDQAWLSVNPAGGVSGGEPDTITVTYAAAALAAGDHAATITVTSAGATNTPVQIPVSLTVLRSAARADFDLDGDVDVEDFGFFQACLSDQLASSTPGCSDADFTGDRYVNSADAALFQNCFTGPNLPAYVNCAE